MPDPTVQSADLGRALSNYGVWTWIWVVALSVWGGVANFFRKMRRGEARPFNFVEFIGEIFVSGFVGVITFLFCESAGFNPLMSSALIAISGHMGSRAIFLFEKMFASRIAPGTQLPDNEP